MLYREIIAVCSQIHTKHINTLCGQNAQFCCVCIYVCNNKTRQRTRTYNVTSRRVRATIVAEEKQLVLHNLRVYL